VKSRGMFLIATVVFGSWLTWSSTSTLCWARSAGLPRQWAASSSLLNDKTGADNALFTAVSGGWFSSPSTTSMNVPLTTTRIPARGA